MDVTINADIIGISQGPGTGARTTRAVYDSAFSIDAPATPQPTKAEQENGYTVRISDAAKKKADAEFERQQRKEAGSFGQQQQQKELAFEQSQRNEEAAFKREARSREADFRRQQQQEAAQFYQRQQMEAGRYKSTNIIA